MLRAGDRVGVGVSGGADSVALLRLLDDLSAELGIRLAVLHFNHQLRGAESDADESFVAQLAAARGIEFLAGRRGRAAAARARGWNLEDAARRLRYAFFASAVKAGRVTRVAVAHTADDQAETVLARLVRGTGPAGLASIYPVKGHVVRPLLEVRRSELRNYLTTLGQPGARTLRISISRACVRACATRSCRFSNANCSRPSSSISAVWREMAREDESFWTALVAERIAALTRAKMDASASAARICWPRPASCPPAPPPRSERWPSAWSAASWQACPARLGNSRRATSNRSCTWRRNARAVIAPNCRAPWSSAASTGFGSKPPAGGKLETSGPAAESKIVSSAAGGFSRMVHLGQAGEDTTVAVPEIGRRIRLKVIDWSGEARETSFGDGAIDGELLRSPLMLRSWRPGDSFRPQGRRRPLKLKQFLREGRIAVRERQGWPVLTSAGVVWARGLPVAAEFSPRKTTRTGVLITEEAM